MKTLGKLKDITVQGEKTLKDCAFQQSSLKIHLSRLKLSQRFRKDQQQIKPLLNPNTTTLFLISTSLFSQMSALKWFPYYSMPP